MIYIHIGYPKTGTTFLQKHVFPHQSGISYFGYEDTLKSGLIDIAYKREYSIDKRKIIKYFHSEKDILISYEGFVGNFLNGVIGSELICERLKGIFPNVKILITVRNQFDMLNSLYIQYVQSGGWVNQEDFFKLKPPSLLHFDINFLKYEYLIEKYVKVFGRDNIHVAPYELLKNDSNKFKKYLNQFLEREVNLSEGNSKLSNKSLDNVALTIYRLSNYFVSSYLIPNDIIPAKFISNHKIWSILHKLSKIPSFGFFDKKFKLNSSVSKKFQLHFDQTSEYLEKEFSLTSLDKFNY